MDIVLCDKKKTMRELTKKQFSQRAAMVWYKNSKRQSHSVLCLNYARGQDCVIRNVRPILNSASIPSFTKAMVLYPITSVWDGSKGFCCFTFSTTTGSVSWNFGSSRSLRWFNAGLITMTNTATKAAKTVSDWSERQRQQDGEQDLAILGSSSWIDSFLCFLAGISLSLSLYWVGLFTQE